MTRQQTVMRCSLDEDDRENQKTGTKSPKKKSNNTKPLRQLDIKAHVSWAPCTVNTAPRRTGRRPPKADTRGTNQGVRQWHWPWGGGGRVSSLTAIAFWEKTPSNPEPQEGFNTNIQGGYGEGLRTKRLWARPNNSGQPGDRAPCKMVW